MARIPKICPTTTERRKCPVEIVAAAVLVVVVEHFLNVLFIPLKFKDKIQKERQGKKERMKTSISIVVSHS